MKLDTKQLDKKQKRTAQITPSLSADLDFAVINGETTLPSKAKFYPTKLLYVRGLRYKEQLEIAQIGNSVEDRLVAWHSVLRVYKNCIIVDNIAFENMLEEDFTTLTLWVTFLTNPEQIYQLQYTCKNCKKEAYIDISPSNIELYDFECFEPQNIETELGTIQVAPTTMQEFMWEQNSEKDALRESLILGKHIKRLNGKPLESLQERLDIYGSLTLKEAKEVREIALKFKSGIMPIDCKCPHCQAEAKITPALDLLKGLP